jgi:predicted nucleotidyltransferase
MIGTEEKQVLAELIAIINALNLPMILVGAGARLLIFDRKFGQGRGTKDWDIGISIDSWASYEKLRDNLIGGDSPCFKATKNLHKFIHIETNIEVDIVPFGKIGDPDQEIVWADSGNSMNVLGYNEALLYAKTASIDDLEIQVINIPAFVILKVFAWGDRGERTNKDLEDIEFILSKYKDDDRVYDELAEELANEVVDFLDANIYLLGRDIYKILQAKTLVELNILLDKLIGNFHSEQPESLG